MNNNLFKKFLTFSYGSWISLIIGLLSTVISTRILNPEDFGKASMFTLAMNISMTFIIFGSDQAFIRFFYEEDEDKRGGLLYNCLKTPMYLLVISSIIIFAFWEELSIALLDEVNIIVMILLVVGIVFQVIFRFSALVIRMQQKGNLYSILLILQKTISITALVAFYYAIGPRFEIIILSTVLDLILLSIFSIYAERKFWNITNISLKQLVHTSKDITRFGSPLVLTSLIIWLFQSFDKIAIRQWSSLNELGLYAAAFKIVALVNVLQGTFSTFWSPVAYEKFQNEPDNKEFYDKIFKIVSFVMFFVAIISIAGKDVIVYLLGKDYREASNIMPFLVFMPTLYTISEITVVGINFFKKPKWHVLIASIACLVNIFGNWILVPLYGALGASVSTAFSYIIFFILRTQISQMYFRINYNLNKTYLMLFIISIYALFSIITSSFYYNILFGMIVLFLLGILYFKDVKVGYRILKDSKAFDKIRKRS